MRQSGAPRRGRVRHARRTVLIAGLAAALLVSVLPGAALAQEPDPRIGLGAGYQDAEQASSNMALQAHRDRPPGFDGAPGNFGFVNSDLAFTGDHAVVGNFNGFQVYDVADPAEPALTTTVVCPGGQGDVSVYGDLLFMSVEETRGQTDCGSGDSTKRFQGVRVFDISDVAMPQQVATVQTCRGSHTHTVVPDEGSGSVFVYVSGTAGVRNDTALAGCANTPASDPNAARWRIDVIEVPLDAPEQAAVVGGPRLFRNPETGAIDGLQNMPQTPTHPSGMPWGPTPITDACHDITAYPAIGLAAGACEGNGILIDISDPANPTRLEEVADPNFAYWHSATFNNDGTKVVFTDEWGGGTAARCRVTDRPEWGANAIFDVVQTPGGPQLEFASYYKLPVPQTTEENCVAHNGSLVPVPGRDILVQSWYQGGISVLDFTDSANPTEIAFFDRGPIDATRLVLGGFWSSYWYNGDVFATEIARGFDTFGLTASDHLNDVELAAAGQVQFDEFNAQSQPDVTWPATFTTVRAWQSAADRQGELDDRESRNLDKFIDRAERFSEGPQRRAVPNQLRAVARQIGDSESEERLRGALLELADELR